MIRHVSSVGKHDCDKRAAPVSSPEVTVAQRGRSRHGARRRARSSPSPAPPPGSGARWPARLAASAGCHARSSPSTSSAATCPGVTWRVLDVRDPALGRAGCADVDVVVHLALDLDLDADPAQRRAYNVRGAADRAHRRAAAGVRRVVLVHLSAMVYGAAARQRGPAAPRTRRCGPPPTAASSATCWRSSGWPPRRRAPPRPAGHRRAARRRWSGPASTACSPATSRRRGCSSCAGSRPRWQFCHVDDLVVGAGARRAAARSTGVVDGRLRRLAGAGARSRRSSGHAPHRAARRARLRHGASGCTGSGMTPAPASDLQYIVYPWVVDRRRGCARRAGGRRATTRPALGQLLEQRAGGTRWSARRLGAQGRHARRRRRHGRRDRHRRPGPAGPPAAPQRLGRRD